jgi:PadR family transcriptional regulator, regulatory protein PadR
MYKEKIAMTGKSPFEELSGYGRGPGRRRGVGRGQRWAGDYSLIDVRLVEPALLAFVKNESLHGYGLLDKLAGLGLGGINPSLIYRILRDYEELGLVESDWDKDTTQGPPKRVYTITEAGLKALNRAASSLRETVDRVESILALIDSVDESMSI